LEGDADRDLCLTRSNKASLRDVVGVCGAVAALRPRWVVGVVGRLEAEASDEEGVRGVSSPESLRMRFVEGVFGNPIELLVGDPGLEVLRIGNGIAKSPPPRFRGEDNDDGVGDDDRVGNLAADPDPLGDTEANTRVRLEALTGILS